MSLILTPHNIVLELNKYIVGQEKAKKSVAVALRNRYRRSCLSDELRDEIMPKNILMIGPTGIGKTEIARRLAKLVNAPFIKVEATKFTEIGYVGRDVESMVRDLIEISVRMVKKEKIEEVELKAAFQADDVLLDILLAKAYPDSHAVKNPLEMLFGAPLQQQDTPKICDEGKMQEKAALKEKLLNGQLDEDYVEVEVEDSVAPALDIFAGSNLEELGMNFQDLFGSFLPKKKKKRKVKISQARKILTQAEAQKLIDMDEVIQEAIHRAEQDGIIFLDEIDKIAGKDIQGPDVSRGGVQRDILPIVEGSTIMTKYGAVKTDYILFIAAGAFHTSKPSDLIPELQGRFPIRVELDSLSQQDFMLILTQPQNSLIKQYTELLKIDDIYLNFMENAIAEIAEIAYTVNCQTENIGARRLHTIMEKMLEEVLFQAPDMNRGELVIDKEYVRERLKNIVENEDLSRYIL